MRVLLLVMLMALFGCAGTDVRSCPSTWLVEAHLETIKSADGDSTRLMALQQLLQVDMHCGYFPDDAVKYEDSEEEDETEE